MRINYSKNSYCSVCTQVRPVEFDRCPDCKQKLRHKRHNGTPTWYKRHREEMMKGSHRRGHTGYITFKVKMRMKRVDRILKGLKPNIPIPESDYETM